MAAPNEWVPDVCTLPTPEQPLRLAEFDGLFESVRLSTRQGPTRLDLVLPQRAEADARNLARRESQCCSFFAFEFDTAGDTVVMRVEVPKEHVDVLDAIEARARQR